MAEITIAGVEEYQMLVEKYPQLDFSKDGELKSFQRPWAFHKIQELVPPKGKILEIGADRCHIAGPLSEMGYEVWVVDPYDGIKSGRAQEYSLDSAKEAFPNINFVAGYIGEELEIPLSYFDSIYSVSVLEHVRVGNHKKIWSKISEYLKQNSYAIDAIDFSVRGFRNNFKKINDIFSARGIQQRAEDLAKEAVENVETFYLSPHAHIKWKKANNKSYKEYPYRNITSLNIILEVN